MCNKQPHRHSLGSQSLVRAMLEIDYAVQFPLKINFPSKNAKLKASNKVPRMAGEIFIHQNKRGDISTSRT